ncbi:MAG: outer membrane protein transport protein [Gallionella sp.]|nr:outer membrane protein transport protein [Gallionella sp.]
MKIKKIVVSLFAAGMMAAPLAHATNGMNMEGYGPVATGMGGASYAYDNGAAAMVNNPTTIGLMADGESRLDVAFGKLGPTVKAQAGAAVADSTGTAYYMPAAGYVQKRGNFAYGIGMFAQGGMGTDFGSTSFMTPPGSGLENRSEVGVGRVAVPLAYDVSNELKIGGSVDFVWASMDLQMAMGGAQFMDMLPTVMNPLATQAGGTLGGGMVTALGAVMPMMNPANPLNWGYFNFSNKDRWMGMARSSGFAGKLGMTYKVSPQLTLGAVYHSKTTLGDMTADGASLSFNANIDTGLAGGGAASGIFAPMTIPVTGKISVVNFQWPETYGFGLAYQASDELMVAADYKRIGWANVMKNFQMAFTADAAQANPMAAAFAGTTLNATMYQNWKDQDVFMFGLAYKATHDLTLRGGLQTSNNPVPDAYLNPLFPAIVKDQYTLGAGYAFNKVSSVDGSLTIVPSVSATGGSGVTSSMSQVNYQVMYTHRF